MNATSRITLKATVITLLILTLALLGYTLWAGGKIVESGIAVVIAATTIIFAAFVLRNMAKSARKGLPLEDEFTKRAKTSAAAFAFYASLYLWLALMYFEDYLPERSLPSMAILGSALIFGLRYLYLVKRGRVD